MNSFGGNKGVRMRYSGDDRVVICKFFRYLCGSVFGMFDVLPSLLNGLR